MLSVSSPGDLPRYGNEGRRQQLQLRVVFADNRYLRAGRSGAAVDNLDERNLRNRTDADDQRRIRNGRRVVLGAGWHGVRMLGGAAGC